MIVDDSLTQGLRTLETLARRGPLDVDGLARLNGWRIERTLAVVAELERAGLVRRVDDPGIFAVTPRATALTSPTPTYLH